MKSAVKMFLMVLMLGLCFTPQANAITAWYQPTPLPAGIPESANHIRDGWIGSYYNSTLVSDDEKWNIGGWGDEYRAYVKFDIEGLPQNVSQAALWLMPYAKGDGSTTTWTEWNLVTGDWTTNMQWGGQPSATFLGYRAPPIANEWYGTNITSWYNGWRSNPSSNYGLRIDPYQVNNNFNLFRSSEYKDFVADPYADGKRPILQLDFNPTLALKMPFNGSRWNVSTEIGGVGCSYVHTGHQGNGYFSIDFTGKAKDANGNIVYPDPSTANIPILAAFDGTVVNYPEIMSSTAGYFVRIQHQDTGISTGYLHMKAPSSLRYGDSVVQGQLLGYMGNTPTNLGLGVHLDFNVQYNGSGTKDQDPLAKIMMDGWLLKSFQVDGCVNGDSQRYYPSSNVIK